VSARPCGGADVGSECELELELEAEPSWPAPAMAAMASVVMLRLPPRPCMLKSDISGRLACVRLLNGREARAARAKKKDKQKPRRERYECVCECVCEGERARASRDGFQRGFLGPNSISKRHYWLSRSNPSNTLVIKHRLQAIVQGLTQNAQQAPLSIRQQLKD